MGIIKCFLDIANDLRQGKKDLTTYPLDMLAASHDNYAYIGNRRTLREKVLTLSSRLRTRISGLRDVQHPSENDTEEQWAAWWYGSKDWAKNSGVFPDFVLACVREEMDYYWRGALLELKDSKGDSVASFNSTLPSATQKFESLPKIVQDATFRYDLPSSQLCDYPQVRRCFYLVRTRAEHPVEVRVSLVEGTFFETLPTDELLREVWKQLLIESGLPQEQADEVVEKLSSLDREEVAISRHIEKASIKPRLRIMSEVESDGNPHTYREIPPRTLNLIVKTPVVEQASDSDAWLLQSMEWFLQQAQAEGLTVENADIPKITFMVGREKISVDLRCIVHRRNGRHLVLQYQH
ncbi:MAG: hypothetical protein KatS3mg023_1853 [Armatimonadota bacterium]|nr:MAG: hypothetical protein KatS3mg023_1853 [Armatimonadota bacterium]